jgi:hypothetical protein
MCVCVCVCALRQLVILYLQQVCLVETPRVRKCKNVFFMLIFQNIHMKICCQLDGNQAIVFNKTPQWSLIRTPGYIWSYCLQQDSTVVSYQNPWLHLKLLSSTRLHSGLLSEPLVTSEAIVFKTPQWSLIRTPGYMLSYWLHDCVHVECAVGVDAICRLEACGVCGGTGWRGRT